jgi:hypothetical protein
MKNNTGIRTFVVADAATIPYGARVELSNGKLVLGSAVSANHLGVAQNDATGGQALAVALINCSGTQEMIAGSAIAVGALVYPAVSGKINVTVGSNLPVGRALQAASGDGEIIEVAPVL